jgi:2-amino-4-hydroxy-6-hydroxymethyldihydropteridine diphosphokinase
MATALIALGSNLGNRQRNLDDAVAQLGRQPNIVVLATSRWRETRPIGGPKDQTEFLNGAVLLGTSLTPQQLHVVLRQIESAAGRTRKSRWAPRTLDLDLLLYDELVIDTPELTLPHPRMSFRRFVLEPAAEIAPKMRHPTSGWTISGLLADLDVPTPGRYITAISGPIAAGKTTLARAVAETVKGLLVIYDPTNIFTGVDLRTGRIGPNFGQQAESLRRRARLLPGQLDRGPSFMKLSDFWLPQSLCFAELTLPEDEMRQYGEQYQQVAGGMPKLVVNLDVPVDVSWQRIAERGDQNPPRLDWLANYRESLLKLVGLPMPGPVLRLDGTKLDEAKDELVAAIQAMQ